MADNTDKIEDRAGKDVTERRGGCLCGAVRYRVIGDVGQPMACHCHMCRRYHGALGVFIGSTRDAVELQGADQVHWTRSSAEAERGSCRVCGSKLFWRSLAGAGMDVTVGSLDRSDDLPLRGHIWVEHRGDYEDFTDHLPKYAASSRKGGEPVEPLTTLAPLSGQPETVEPPYRGGCLCGAVHFEVATALQDVIVCHCAQCLHWHGYAGAYTITETAAVTLHGEAELAWYRAAPEIRRGFCRSCLSCLFWQALKDGQPVDRMSISAGALDGPTGLKTVRHLFLAS